MLSFVVDDEEETAASVDCGSSPGETGDAGAAGPRLPKRRLLSEAAVSAAHPDEGSRAAPLFKSSRKPKALRTSAGESETRAPEKSSVPLTHAEFLRRRAQELRGEGAGSEQSPESATPGASARPRRRRCGWDPPEAEPTDIAEFIASAKAQAPPPPQPGKGAWGPELPAEAVARQAAAIEAAVAADAKEREAQEAWERKQRRLAQGDKGNFNDDPVERMW